MRAWVAAGVKLGTATSVAVVALAVAASPIAAAGNGAPTACGIECVVDAASVSNRAVCKAMPTTATAKIASACITVRTWRRATDGRYSTAQSRSGVRVSACPRACEGGFKDQGGYARHYRTARTL